MSVSANSDESTGDTQSESKGDELESSTYTFLEKETEQLVMRLLLQRPKFKKS